MNKTRKNQAGFSAIEAIVIVFVLVVVGGAGYLVYANHHKKTKTDSATTTSTTKPESTSKAPTTTDPYAGWATCSDPVIGASIKYQSSWQNNVTNPTNSDGNPCGQYPSSSIRLVFEAKSPKIDGKLFRIWYMPGDQYNKDTISDLQKIVFIKPATTAAGKSLSLIGYADQYNDDQKALSGIALTDQHFTVGQSYRGYPTITASNGKQFAVNATLAQDDGGDAESYVLSVYEQQPSYQDVLKTLQSVTY